MYLTIWRSFKMAGLKITEFLYLKDVSVFLGKMISLASCHIFSDQRTNSSYLPFLNYNILYVIQAGRQKKRQITYFNSLLISMGPSVAKSARDAFCYLPLSASRLLLAYRSNWKSFKAVIPHNMEQTALNTRHRL